MWQDVGTVIIAIAVAVIALYRLWRNCTRPSSPCDTCAGCPLKDQLKKKNAGKAQ
jgi:hypothetical protein